MARPQSAAEWIALSRESSEEQVSEFPALPERTNHTDPFARLRPFIKPGQHQPAFQARPQEHSHSRPVRDPRRPQSWACTECTFENLIGLSCEMCGTSRAKPPPVLRRTLSDQLARESGLERSIARGILDELGRDDWSLALSVAQMIAQDMGHTPERVPRMARVPDPVPTMARVPSWFGASTQSAELVEPVMDLLHKQLLNAQRHPKQCTEQPLLDPRESIEDEVGGRVPVTHSPGAYLKGLLWFLEKLTSHPEVHGANIGRIALCGSCPVRLEPRIAAQTSNGFKLRVKGHGGHGPATQEVFVITSLAEAELAEVCDAILKAI